MTRSRLIRNQQAALRGRCSRHCDNGIVTESGRWRCPTTPATRSLGDRNPILLIPHFTVTPMVSVQFRGSRVVRHGQQPWHLQLWPAPGGGPGRRPALCSSGRHLRAAQHSPAITGECKTHDGELWNRRSPCPRLFQYPGSWVFGSNYKF